MPGGRGGSDALGSADAEENPGGELMQLAGCDRIGLAVGQGGEEPGYAAVAVRWAGSDREMRGSGNGANGAVMSGGKRGEGVRDGREVETLECCEREGCEGSKRARLNFKRSSRE